MSNPIADAWDRVVQAKRALQKNKTHENALALQAAERAFNDTRKENIKCLQQ